MSEQALRVRVVLVSPGDVARERVAAQSVVDELNRTVAGERGLVLSLWRWESDAFPAVHFDGPQGHIDELMGIADADIVVGVFWKRFGTPTGDTESGTEHELRRAWATWEQHGRPQVMVYFRSHAYEPVSSEQTAQWGAVLDFKRDLPKEQLWWAYATPTVFKELFREHLTRFLLDRYAGSAAAPPSRVGLGVRFNLPAVAASFTGRDVELRALDEALARDDRAVITQAIAGQGGVGKSQLAARYAQLHQDRYDIVAWVGAEDGGIADLASLADALGCAAEGLAPGEQAQWAVRFLSACRERWLLVLDNVQSAAQLQPLLPHASNGRVLVTSRDRSLAQFARVFSVDVFDEETATRYLLQRSGRAHDEDAARRVARALGCLPLALSHAAAYCQAGESFTNYLALLELLPATELFDRRPEESYAQTVASTWTASITAARSDAPLAANVLDMAAYLAADAIPKTLFSGLLEDAADPRARKGLGDACNALARYSLATVGDDTIDVHRLLQKVIRDALEQRADHTGAQRALAAVDDAFAHDTTTPTVWSRCEQLLTHALALADTMPPDAAGAPTLIGLLNRATDYLHYSHGGHRALAACQRVASDADRLLGPEDPHTLETRNNLAGAYQAVGRVADAIAIYEPLLADYERILGAERPDTLTSRNNLASAYEAVGRVADAIAIYEPLLADYERILGAERPDTLTTRHNLAGAYQAVGRVADAIAIYEPLLADYERILGAEHPDTLTTRNNLAYTYQANGRVADAIAIYEPLVTDHERILGAEHPSTLTTRHNLAGAYQTVGRVADAIAIYGALLADRERILGAEHPDTLSTRHSLAGASRSAGHSG